MGQNNGNGTGAGNGTSALAKRATEIVSESPAAAELMELPPWMKAMRDAMAESISAQDITDVMKKQVEKAREGDMKSAAFVMNQAHKMMESAAKKPPVTIIQNNYYDNPRPDAPLEPGDDAQGEDVRKMRARARAGVPITGNPSDRRVRPVSDEEEKELIRRRQAEDEERERRHLTEE